NCRGSKSRQGWRLHRPPYILAAIWRLDRNWVPPGGVGGSPQIPGIRECPSGADVWYLRETCVAYPRSVSADGSRSRGPCFPPMPCPCCTRYMFPEPSRAWNSRGGAKGRVGGGIPRLWSAGQGT